MLTWRCGKFVGVSYALLTFSGAKSATSYPVKLLIKIELKLPCHTHNDGVPCSNQGVATIFGLLWARYGPGICDNWQLQVFDFRLAETVKPGLYVRVRGRYFRYMRFNALNRLI